MALRVAAPLLFALAAACNPAPSEDYAARVGLDSREGPSAPILSPDTEGAIWAPSPANARRLLYGKPGQPPLFALECQQTSGGPVLAYTRFAPADAHAKAILALIGNGHVARLNIDAARAGRGWLWQGSEPAMGMELEALTGARSVEATVPGAGSLILNPSPLPGALIEACRALAAPASPASAPGEAAAAVSPAPGTTGTAGPPPRPAR